jgi:hypothetical protein
MPFEIQDFHDLVRLLEAHPEWRAELRRLVLSEELLRLPELVQQLIEAHRRAEERLDRLEATVAQLVEAQRKAEERLQRAEARLERVEKRLERVEKRLEHVEIRLDGVEKRLEKTEDRLSKVWGGFLESRYRERAHAYFAPILSRIRVLSGEQLVQLLDEALEAGRLTEADRRDLLLADLVLQGRRDDQTVYLVAEVSGLISEDDVRRAVDRAQALARATERPVIAAVAGETLPTDVQALAAQRGVWCITDGHVLSPAP